ncbi:ABC transporter substrate-binding protein [Acidimicrobiia bacterium EGI L10123]|uniref:ABC transporter substrate-binding protein n=1 Tax=Salinilacustrithrix flava TaxID=2957203 RepID=UPI003D7C3035|nr:ABC transporter substrate-binding protein [Acidimicrobiia bacterium EGI L10123]
MAAAVLLLLAACGGDDGPGPTARPGVVVASFSFAESELVAEIYAQALEASGLTVHRQLGLGQRELVLPALRGGLVDVVPEYAGSALDAVAPGSEVERGDVDAVFAALAEALDPWGVSVLDPASASNENVLAVRGDAARELDLRTVSDLVGVADGFVLGGPPECPRRPRCLPGLESRYGLDFAGFEPFADAVLVRRALIDGVIDVGVLFSTDAALTADGITVLLDDRGLQPPDNVVPVVRTEALADPRIRATLDEVSAALTTESLRLMNWRLANAGTDPEAEARAWLVRRGLVDR